MVTPLPACEPPKFITWEAHKQEMDRVWLSTSRIMNEREDYITHLEQIIQDLDAALRSK